MRWLIPADLPQYLVSDEGDVVRFLKSTVTNVGYLAVSVVGSKNRYVYVSRLVAEAFIGPKPTRLVIAYRDHDRLNCRAANLEYATRTEVLLRRYRDSYTEPVTTATGEWRRHPTRSQLLVCDDGRVARNLHPATVNGGYRRLTVAKHPVYVHRLILSAFIGPAPTGAVANHIDGNPSNNRVDNLEWVTQGQNLEHRHRVLGWAPVGAKLTPDQVRSIRTLPASVGLAEIAERYGIHYQTAYRVRRGISYRSVA